MTDSQQSKDTRNANFENFIEEHKDAIREHADSQSKTFKQDDEWAGEHEWDEMYKKLKKGANES
ncbi:hypothetical protein BBD42_21600 [Paenibacillus sp. BIHB 4019]|uniref:Uncharacterized protein n=2 Tax=Paenibacillus sp. BIHB 4019 TaxID=1870819 RepID=A0A1B2DM36_9BACL|nr:hypothetical protein BBD42_21600 [Paenibacillus sp. BIHB 4019]